MTTTVRRIMRDDVIPSMTPARDTTVFCKKRDRFLDGGIAAKYFFTVLKSGRRFAAPCPASTFRSTAR
ncbi:hypothetical protein RAD15_23990 [Bradyrhizobium sp. 14AA]